MAISGMGRPQFAVCKGSKKSFNDGLRFWCAQTYKPRDRTMQEVPIRRAFLTNFATLK